MNKQGLGQDCFTLRERDIWNKLLVKVTEVQSHRDKGIPKSVSGREDLRIGWKKQVGWIKLSYVRTGMSAHTHFFLSLQFCSLVAFLHYQPTISSHTVTLTLSHLRISPMLFNPQHISEFCVEHSDTHDWYNDVFWICKDCEASDRQLRWDSSHLSTV